MLKTPTNIRKESPHVSSHNSSKEKGSNPSKKVSTNDEVEMGSLHVSNDVKVENLDESSSHKSLSNIEKSEFDDNDHDLLMEIDNISDISGLSENSY